MIRVAILTVSDSCAAQSRVDVSGQTIKGVLPAGKFEICDYRIVADEHKDIEEALIDFADTAGADVVFATGGTGLWPRDVTPEATATVCQQMVPGLAETMRSEGLKKTKNAMLSRVVAGIRGNTIVINLPGSVKGIEDSL